MSSADKNSKSPGKRGIAWVAIIVSLIAIAVVLVLTLSGPDTGGKSKDTEPNPSGVHTSAVPSENNDIDDENNEIVMSAYGIDVEGDSLVSAVALAEGENAWSGMPAYVFIGELKQTEENNDEETNPSFALAELMTAARNAAKSWGDDFNRAQMLEKCQCIPSERYLLIISNEKYSPLASIFEEAANDPTVLDVEDLIGRMSSFTPVDTNETREE